MHRVILLILSILAGVGVVCGADVDAKDAAQPVAGTLVFEGSFLRRGQKTDAPLKLTLTPDGDGWQAVFDFTWKKQPKTWTSTWSGDPNGGKVSGTAANNKKKVTHYSFEGAVTNGVLTMQHWKMNKDKKGARTGTATLKRADVSSADAGDKK